MDSGESAHSLTMSGNVDVYCLFVEPDESSMLPRQCCTLSVSPLLERLLMHAAHMPVMYDVDGPDGRIATVLLDQLSLAPVERFNFPMPVNARLLSSQPGPPTQIRNKSPRTVSSRTPTSRHRSGSGPRATCFILSIQSRGRSGRSPARRWRFRGALMLRSQLRAQIRTFEEKYETPDAGIIAMRFPG